MIRQRTIKEAASTRGVGIHSGKEVNMTLIPAGINHGVVFKRVDVGSKLVRAHNDFVNNVNLSTGIECDNVKVSTIEHLMSALSALGIDNILVELDAYEVPIMDGSSALFIFLIQSVGIKEQEAYKRFFVVREKVMIKNGDSWAQVLPYEGFRVSIEIDFLHRRVIESGQKISIDFAQQSYLKEISRARTFGFVDDVEDMQKRNLVLGANMNNAIALSRDEVLNKGGVRYCNEFVKHKVLDIVGDLYLLGSNFIGHYEGYKTGHSLNNKLMSVLLKKKCAWKIKTFEEKKSPIHFYSEDW